MARPPVVAPPAPDSAPEIVAEIRRLRQLVIIRIANAETDVAQFRQMDAGLRRSLASLGYPEPAEPAAAHDADVRMVQGLDDVRGEVEALRTELAELSRAVRHDRLVDEGFISQAYEAIRGLRAEVHDIPALTVAPVSLAVGAALRDAGLIGPVPEPPAAEHAIEVGAGSPRRRLKKTG